MLKKYVFAACCFTLLGLFGCGVSQEDFDKKAEELDSAKQEIAKLEEQIKEKDGRIAELEKEQGADAKKLETLQQDVEAANKKVEQAAQEEKNQAANLSRSKAEMEALNKKVGTLQDLLAERENQIALLEERFDDVAQDLDTFRNLSKKNSKDLKKMGVALEQKDALLTDKDNQIKALMEQLELLQEGGNRGPDNIQELLKK
jgi:chromosome segregation ATPase